MSSNPLKIVPANEPATVPVLMMECFLAGLQYNEAGKYWDHLSIGESLTLVREPGNPHDARAVRVDWLGATLGYLPCEATFAVSQMLDRGELVEARIANKREGAILVEVIVIADPSRGLPPLQRARPPFVASTPMEIVAVSEAGIRQRIQGLAWMAAGKMIEKAKLSK
jgi:hypothetical protein